MIGADLNLDGNPDLVVANADANSLSILLGRGDGRFTRTDIAAPGSPRGVAVADMNRDGRPDLVYTGFTINRVQVLLGDGRGGFTAGTAFTGHAQRPQGIAAADFNRDGTVDLAVAYASAGGGLAVVSMDRAGRPTTVSTGGPGDLNLVTTGDFDEDGWLDAAAVSSAGNRLEIFLGGSAGPAHAATYSTGASPRGLRAVDLNHDGRLDLVTANRSANTVTVFTGRLDARASFDSATFPAGPGSRDVAAADFNHDGRLDLAAANQDAAALSVLVNETQFLPAAYVLSRERLPSPNDYPTGRVSVANLNHNGIPDLIAENYVLLDGTDLRTLTTGLTIHASADLNADGHVDLVVGEYNGPARVWTNDGRGTFTPDVFLPTPVDRQSIDLADMNADGRLDLIVSTYSAATGSGTMEVMLRQADGSWISASRTTVPSWTLSVDFADLNLDGRLDVLTTYYQPTRLDVFLGDGSGGLGPARSYSLPEYATGVAIGDVNHDGAPDVVAGGWEYAAVFMGSRGGRLTPREVLTVEGFEPKLADMNMDGHLDIVVAWTSILPGAGDGTFSSADRFDTVAFYAAIADFNGDGLPDLVADGLAIYNRRSATNSPPTVTLQDDFAIDYSWQYGDEGYEIAFEASDPDLHALSYEWRNEAGDIVTTEPWLQLDVPPGTHQFTLTVFDGRGASARDDVVVTVRPDPEVVMHYYSWFGFYPNGSWEIVEDPTAADGFRAHDPDTGAPKLPAPEADPVDYLMVEFVADPTQTYKLWIRGKAERNHWANDSVWLQFSGATDLSGRPVYRIGTTRGLDVNLEECAGCGLSGWGWRDERWGATLDAAPLLLRFPDGGVQTILIQSREDGLSIDQIVLSAERYLNAPPGPPKNDTTIVQPVP
jgi:hypothetical protein